MRVNGLLLTKPSPWCRIAQTLAHGMMPFVESDGGPLPESVRAWEGDWLLSFYCPWVLPAATLARTRRGAINIHPGSPLYPGFGCYDFALLEKARVYGATMHFMAPQVDSGPIIAWRAVPVLDDDSVAKLQARTAVAALELFVQLLAAIRSGQPIRANPDLRWARRAFTKRDLDAVTGP